MRKVVFFLFIIFAFGACNNQQQNQQQHKKTITVSILPQKYFIEKITGDYFNINVMIPPGASPATYEPTPRQMKELSASELYVRIGYIEFEKEWMPQLQNINPQMAILNQAINANLIEPEDDHENNHEHIAHHHHGIDPHIWTSPKEVKKQVELLYEYFTSNYPELKPQLTKNYADFISEIDSLDEYLNNELQAFKGSKFLIFHPALSYFARDYGLEQISIEIEGKEPTPSGIQKIIETAKHENIKVVFVQKQFSSHNAEVIAKEINGSVVKIDPLSENWAESIKMIADEIVKSYSEK